MVHDSKNIDTNLWSAIYHDSWLEILCYDSWRLRESSQPKLVILGSSNARIGFRPAELQPLFPEYEIANLSGSAANISDIRQTFELLHIVFPDEVFKKSVFAIGMFYGIYQEKGSPETIRVNEGLLKTGLYRREGGNIRPIVPAKYMYTLIRILRPFNFLNSILVNIKKYYNNFLIKIKEMLRIKKYWGNELTPHEDVNGHTSQKGYLTEEDKRWWIERHSQYKNGEDLKKGVKELSRLCREAQKWGGTVVLIDLPLPDWHMEMSSFFKDYQKEKLNYIHKATQYDSVHYLDLQYGNGLTDEANFKDATHPKDNVTALWSKSLKERWDDALK